MSDCCYNTADWPDCCDDERHCCYNIHSPKTPCPPDREPDTGIGCACGYCESFEG